MLRIGSAGHRAFQRFEQPQQPAEMRLILRDGICRIEQSRHGGTGAQLGVARTRRISKSLDNTGGKGLDRGTRHLSILRPNRQVGACN
jgi:hypothetical protein